MRLGAVLALAFLAAPLPAWGPLAHRVVARLAQERLSQRALEGLGRLRADAAGVDLRTRERDPAFRFIDRDLARFLDPSRPLDLALIACWADGWKRVDPATEAWHFVDLDLGCPLDAAQLARSCPDGNCVTGAVAAQAAVLADGQAGPRSRLMALAFLVHLVADLHQPLHCATRGDRGGNALRVLYLGEPMSLHEVWDTALLEERGVGTRRLVRRIDAATSGEEAWVWRRGQPVDWALESADLARREAYGRLPAGPEPLILARRYRVPAQDVAKLQVAKAGIRLATVLNQCFEER